MAIFIFTGCASMSGDGEEAVSGDNREDIRQVIRDNTGQMNACYEARRQAVKHLRGKMILDWIVKSDGSVGPVRVVQSLDPVVDRCAVEALKAWKFTPFKDKPFQKIRYPFVFRGN